MKNASYIFLFLFSFLLLLSSATAEESNDEGKDIVSKSHINGDREYPVNEGGITPNNVKPAYYNMIFICIIITLIILAALFIIANVIRKTPSYSIEECSHCKSIKLERIPRTSTNRLLNFFLVKSRIKRYRCLNCNWEGIKVTDKPA